MEGFLLNLYIAVEQFLARSGMSVSPQVIHVSFIVVSVFLLLLALGFTRHHMLHWSVKGAQFGILLGIVLTLAVEGVLLVSGRTVVAQVLHNENTPPIVREFIQKNISELAQALTGEPSTLGAREASSAGAVISRFEQLTQTEQEQVKQQLCLP